MLPLIISFFLFLVFLPSPSHPLHLSHLHVSTPLLPSLTIPFSPLLTTITGEPGSGKSLLISALETLSGGKPREPGLYTAIFTDGGPTTINATRVVTSRASRAYVCGERVSLSELREVVGPCATRVDAGQAARPLNDQDVIRALDAGVDCGVLERAEGREKVWKGKRAELRRLKKLLSKGDDVETLTFWTEEIDAALEAAASVRNRCGELIRQPASSGDEGLAAALEDVGRSMRGREERLASCELSLESIRSAADSVRDARSALFDAQGSAGKSKEAIGEVYGRGERAHDAVNDLEASLEAAKVRVESVADALQQEGWAVTEEEVLGALAGLRSLARKHSVDADNLRPTCDALKDALSATLSGSTAMEAAEKAERDARGDYDDACARLTEAREEVAAGLSSGVTALLQELGMEGCEFTAVVEPGVTKGCTGMDAADFLMRHNAGRTAGPVASCASSGERARILLAVETCLPGSVSSTRGGGETGTVVYDEIDSHVGGSAGVKVARMLSKQGRSRQVISVTHNPTIAALADHHIRVERRKAEGGEGQDVRVEVVEGVEREMEVARMAGGGAVEEREERAFAKALLGERGGVRLGIDDNKT